MSYGTLEVITGPMFSGKSTKLLQRALFAKSVEGRKTLILKPAIDTRYGQSQVVSHDGLKADALAVGGWPDIPQSTQLVLIDEVQFLADPNFRGDLVAEVKWLLRHGIDVVAAGLDVDWRGHPFEVTARLMAMADQVEKRAAICRICGCKATKSFKKVPNDQVIELGEADAYEARCNKHWQQR